MYHFYFGRITITFTLIFAQHLFLGGIFHKIKGTETLSRSHNNVNTTDENKGLTESFSASTELYNMNGEI
jgi:hypothetical protein